MTVRELINELQKHDSNLIVKVVYYGETDIDNIYEDGKLLIME